MKKEYAIVLLLGSSLICNAQTELVFSYDVAGNQIQRLINSTASKQLVEQVSESIEEETIEQKISNSLKTYPNPTAGKLKIEWNPIYTASVKEVTITDSGAINTFKANLIEGQNSVEIDLTPHASGLYIVHFLLDDKKVISKKIIKN